MTDAAPGDLLALAAQLVGIPSVSHQEKVLADVVESALRASPWLSVERVGDNVVARTDLGRERRLVLAGHLDTVPPAGNERAVVEGDVLTGLGAADMKGGLAVLLHLATTLRRPAVDVTWCFYSCEEVAHEHNGLVRLWSEHPDLLAADAAVLGEPTGGAVEAGCQGTLRARITMGGSRAHTARPWAGVNAIHRLGPVLDAVAGSASRRVLLDGCEYAEQLQAVGVEGGVAANVVPDRVTLTVNRRFAPDRDGAGAERDLRDLLEPLLDPGAGDTLEIVEVAAGAPPALGHPLLADLVARTGVPPRAKVGWTDVATFWAHGLPATNFGPGDPLLAHTPGEHVSRRELEHAAAVLAGLLGSAG